MVTTIQKYSTRNILVSTGMHKEYLYVASEFLLHDYDSYDFVNGIWRFRTYRSNGTLSVFVLYYYSSSETNELIPSVLRLY